MQHNLLPLENGVNFANPSYLSSRTTFLCFANQRDGNATCVDDSDGISARASQTCSINDWGFREDGHCHFQNDIAYWILDSACIFHAAGVSLKMEAVLTPAREIESLKRIVLRNFVPVL